MSIQTQTRLIGDWASPIRRAELQESLERIKSQEEQRIETVAYRIVSSPGVSSNDDEDTVTYCTPCSTPRGQVQNQVMADVSGSCSTVPSNQVTPEKLFRERKIFIETHVRNAGSPPRLVSFDVQRAERYYDKREVYG